VFLNHENVGIHLFINFFCKIKVLRAFFKQKLVIIGGEEFHCKSNIKAFAEHPDLPQQVYFSTPQIKTIYKEMFIY
jgi:hypothetical protein